MSAVLESMREAPYSAFLLASLQLSLTFILLISVWGFFRLLRAGAVSLTWPAAVRAGCDLLCGVGLMPWWTGRVAVVIPCAASVVVLACILDSFIGHTPVSVALTSGLILLVAAVIALAKVHSAASLDGSFTTWFMTGSGVFLLVMCVVSSSTDTVWQRVGHAVLGLACTVGGSALMAV